MRKKIVADNLMCIALETKSHGKMRGKRNLIKDAYIGPYTVTEVQNTRTACP